MSQAAPSPIGGPPREAGGPAPTPSEVEDLQQRIRRTREDLGQTVAALTAKTRVRARIRDKAAATADRVWHSAPVSRARGYDPLGRVRTYDPLGRVRTYDLPGRVRTYDLPGRARANPAPVLVLAGAVTGLTGLAVIARRRGRPARTQRNRRRGRR